MVGLLGALFVLAWITAVAAYRGSTVGLVICGWFWLVGLISLYSEWRAERRR